jgi:predicted NBD/HSP70 family sugar kinase
MGNKYFIGVDIGGTTYSSTCFDYNGNVIENSPTAMVSMASSQKELNHIAIHGNEKAKFVWNKFGQNLGECLSHVINLINPHAIPIGGGLSHAFPHFEK